VSQKNQASTPRATQKSEGSYLEKLSQQNPQKPMAASHTSHGGSYLENLAKKGKNW
jgi:hypothetical protein